MRQFLLGLSISIAFILGCVTAQHVPGLAMPAASAYAGQRWEYTCEPLPAAAISSERHVQTTNEFLNDYGADGWEIVPYPLAFACFKRPA